MKNLLSILLFSALVWSCSTDNLDIISEAEADFKLIKTKDFKSLKNDIVNKEEIKVLLKKTNIIPKISDNEIDSMVSLLNESDLINTLETEIINATSNFDEINYKNAILDSIRYIIINPKEGKDEITPWPNSKDYKYNKEKLTFIRYTIYFSDHENKYSITITKVALNNKLKFALRGIDRFTMRKDFEKE